MAPITRFEEIRAWQEARILIKQIYSLTDVGLFAKDFGLRDQLRRAAISIATRVLNLPDFLVSHGDLLSRFNRYSMPLLMSVMSHKMTFKLIMTRPTKSKLLSVHLRVR